MRFAFSVLVVASLVGCSSKPEDPPALPESVETEAEELASADVDPNEETIADEDDLVTDDDDDVVLAAYEADVDDSAGNDGDESDESEDAPLEVLSLHPTVDAPTGEKVNGMKPRHCTIAGKKIDDCMCFFSPLNCQLPSTQRGRNRIMPHDLYTEITKRTDAERAKGKKVSTPTDLAAWSIAPGTIIYDGNGVARGTIKDKYASGEVANDCFGYEGTNDYQPVKQGGTCTKVDFGLKKKMGVEGNATMVYAFAVTAEHGAVSGWVKIAAVDAGQRDELVHMRTVAGKTIASRAFANTDYVLRTPAEYGKKLPSWFEAKVIAPKTTCAELLKTVKNGKVGDYMVRGDNTWNLAYNTPGPGGIAVDTFIVGKGALGFQRVKSTKARPTLVRVKTYCSSEMKTMIFAYGAIASKTGLRFGWAPLRALEKGKATAAATTPAPAPAATTSNPQPSNQPIPGDVCPGKADGFYCLGVGDDTVAAHCVGGAAADAVACPGGFHCTQSNAAITCSN